MNCISGGSCGCSLCVVVQTSEIWCTENLPSQESPKHPHLRGTLSQQTTQTQNSSVEPHLRAETLLRGDLICHEFIHKLTWPIMRQPHALRSLFITLHCVTLLRLNLVQSVYDAVSRIRAKHVSNRCSEFVL